MLPVHAHTPSCLHAQVPSPAPTQPCSHPPMCSHGRAWGRQFPEALCASLLPAPLWPSQKGISSCKAAADRFRGSLPSGCWAKLMVHQHPASPALPCWLPGVGEEGPTGGHLQHPVQPPLPCSLPSTVSSAFTLPCSTQHKGHCPPQLKALLQRGGQESPQCPAPLQRGGQAQEHVPETCLPRLSLC